MGIFSKLHEAYEEHNVKNGVYRHKDDEEGKNTSHVEIRKTGRNEHSIVVDGKYHQETKLTANQVRKHMKDYRLVKAD